MAHILHIDSSPRAESSHSRKLTKEFINARIALHPQDTISYRDVGHYPVPHVDEAWVAAAFSSPAEHTPSLTQAIRLSDELVDEFLAADLYVFGVPMYNWSVPSTFKAYIDQIMRFGRTFTKNSDGNFEGLAKGKRMVVITSRGSSLRPGTPLAAYDFQEPFLRTAFGFAGIADISFIHADNLNWDEALRNQSLAEARTAISDIVNHWG